MSSKPRSIKTKLGSGATKINKIKKSIHQSLKDSIAAAPPELIGPAKKIILGAILLFAGVTAYKFVALKREEAFRAAEIEAGPQVRTGKIARSSGEHDVAVLGETRPYQTATLYAKVSGYLKSMKVDKGDIVKQGQVLAVIESPETDQAYSAAMSNAKNKHDIAARMTSLLQQGLVSQQEAEQAQSDDEVASAQYRSAETLKGYETIRAPFNGTITARFADPGALVQNATNAATGALPLVTISELKRLRVDIFLDQRDAPFVEKDEPVEITLSERSGLKIKGRVDRISDQLDSRSKMMLIEIDIPNEDRRLVAGSFVQVSLKIKALPYCEAPVEALVLKQNKPFLTIIDSNNHLTYRPVELANNNGKTLWVLSGVNKDEVVALNVGDSIPEGSKVRPLVVEDTTKKDENKAPTASVPAPSSTPTPPSPADPAHPSASKPSTQDQGAKK